MVGRSEDSCYVTEAGSGISIRGREARRESFMVSRLVHLRSLVGIRISELYKACCRGSENKSRIAWNLLGLWRYLKHRLTIDAWCNEIMYAAIHPIT